MNDLAPTRAEAERDAYEESRGVTCPECDATAVPDLYSTETLHKLGCGPDEENWQALTCGCVITLEDAQNLSLCGECLDGIVLRVGYPDRETGHQAYRCDRCTYSG